MLISGLKKNCGYTLIEIILVIVIIGIIVSISLRTLQSVNSVERFEKNRDSMENLAKAITGDPALISGGTRTDFGYVGDVGALPPNLDALFQNPGGLATWQGPYIRDKYSSSSTTGYFKKDPWGVNYQYSGGLTITSNGSGAPISYKLANSTRDLLYNRVRAVIYDLNHAPPGTGYRDSIVFRLIYPNGAGSLVSVNKSPASDGLVTFDSIPIGLHELKIIYLPDNDTLTRPVEITPGLGCYTEITLNDDLW